MCPFQLECANFWVLFSLWRWPLVEASMSPAAVQAKITVSRHFSAPVDLIRTPSCEQYETQACQSTVVSQPCWSSWSLENDAFLGRSDVFSWTFQASPPVLQATSAECWSWLCILVYVIAWFTVVFGINSMSNAEIIIQGANLLHYECY